MHYVYQHTDYCFEETVSLINSTFPDKPPLISDRYGIEEKKTKRVTSKEDIQ